VWLIGAVVCLLDAKFRGRYCCSLTRAMNGRIERWDIISSCQSAATSEMVKALLVTSLTNVRSAMASTRLFTFLSLFSALNYGTVNANG